MSDCVASWSPRDNSGGCWEVLRRCGSVFEMADRVAPTDATVLILGESGTGKDLLAQEIHARSPRAGKAFVAVNCAALPENLIESELFGYEKGAFTGAAQQRKGKFELAHGGTLFLDEIGDMNSVTQAKVLRALESRKIERLGGSFSVDVDVRVISATHRNLPAEIAAGRFREDLFYRLRVVTLELPPLRAHKDDIALLTNTFLAQLGVRHGRTVRLNPEALELLRRYDWPGNIRELRNALERTLVLAAGAEISAADLPEEIRNWNWKRRWGRSCPRSCREFVPWRERFPRGEEEIRDCVFETEIGGASLECVADGCGGGIAPAELAGEVEGAEDSEAGEGRREVVPRRIFAVGSNVTKSRSLVAKGALSG